MDGRTVRGNQKEQIFGIGTSCIHGRFVHGEIWCKILRLASGEVIQSSGREIGQHHGEAVRENELRRICLCVER